MRPGGTDSPEGHRDDVIALLSVSAGGEESGGGLSEHRVSHRFRRVKTDQMDLGKLLGMLMRCHRGEKKIRNGVQVPSVMAENGLLTIRKI